MFGFINDTCDKKKKKSEKKSHGGESNPFIHYVSGTAANITTAITEYYCIIVCRILHKIN